MSPDEASALERLYDLAHRGCTGELICAMADVEVHVHLQAGRIAWATSSLHRLAFARYVVEECDIDSVALRELVLECQRERKPLGETLIAWGVASADGVRTALRRQVVEAVGCLGTGGETIFLKRESKYRTYNEEFTFPLEEIYAAAAPRHSPPTGSERSPARSSDRPCGQVGSLVELDSKILWAELYRDGVLSDRASAGPSRTPARAFGDILPKHSASLVVRSKRQSLIGFRLPKRGGTVWCGLDRGAQLGTIRALAQEHMGCPPRSRGRARVAPGEVRIGQDRGIHGATLDELMQRSDELAAVVLVDRALEAHCLAWRGEPYSNAGTQGLLDLAELLKGLSSTLPADEWMSTDAPFMSLAAECETGWLFGGELLDRTARQLWIVMSPGPSQGLGWALLTALLRRTSLTRRELRR